MLPAISALGSGDKWTPRAHRQCSLSEKWETLSRKRAAEKDTPCPALASPCINKGTHAHPETPVCHQRAPKSSVPHTGLSHHQLTQALTSWMHEQDSLFTLHKPGMAVMEHFSLKDLLEKPLAIWESIGNIQKQRWMDLSVIKSSGRSSWSYRGHGFNAQHPYSQPSITPIPKDKMFSSGFHGHQTLIYYTDIHTDKTPIHTHQSNNNNKTKQKEGNSV